MIIVSKSPIERVFYVKEKRKGREKKRKRRREKEGGGEKKKKKDKIVRDRDVHFQARAKGELCRTWCRADTDCWRAL